MKLKKHVNSILNIVTFVLGGKKKMRSKARKLAKYLPGDWEITYLP